MGFFDFAKVCLYSEVSGVVMLYGEPIAGAEVIRSATWREKLYTDTVTTDTYGRFQFDPMFALSVLHKYVLPIEPYISQTMIIRYQGKEHLAWKVSKRGYELNDEFTDHRAHPLSCELSAEPAMKDDPLLFLPVKTICKW